MVSILYHQYDINRYLYLVDIMIGLVDTNILTAFASQYV